MATECIDRLESGEYQNRRMLILGAGYVGGALAALALRGGMHVTALTRNHQKAQQLQNAGVQDVLITRVDGNGWHDEVGKPDYIVNCVSSAGGGIAGYRQSYLEGMESVAQWAQKSGSQARFIFTSSTSVYPQSEGETVDENSDCSGCSESGKILLQAEDVVRNAGFAQWWVLRLGGIYGPGRHYLLDAIKEGRQTLPGNGEHYLNLIHQWDICRAIFAALLHPEDPESGVYNVTDGNPAPKAEIAQWLAEELGQSAPAFDGAASGGRSAKRLNQAGKLPNRIVSNENFVKKMDWTPYYGDFKTGFRDILRTM